MEPGSKSYMRLRAVRSTITDNSSIDFFKSESKTECDKLFTVFHVIKKKTFNLITGLFNAEEFLDWKDSFSTLSSSDDVTNAKSNSASSSVSP